MRFPRRIVYRDDLGDRLHAVRTLPFRQRCGPLRRGQPIKGAATGLAVAYRGGGGGQRAIGPDQKRPQPQLAQLGQPVMRRQRYQTHPAIELIFHVINYRAGQNQTGTSRFGPLQQIAFRFLPVSPPMVTLGMALAYFGPDGLPIGIVTTLAAVQAIRKQNSNTNLIKHLGCQSG